MVRPAAAMAASTTFRKDTGTPNWFGRYCPKGQYRAARSRDLLLGHDIEGPRQQQRSPSRNHAQWRLPHDVEGDLATSQASPGEVVMKRKLFVIAGVLAGKLRHVARKNVN